MRSTFSFCFSGFALVLRCDPAGHGWKSCRRSPQDLAHISGSESLRLCARFCVCWSSARHPLRLSGCALSLSLLLSVSASLILSGCAPFLDLFQLAVCLPAVPLSQSLRLCAPGRSLRILSASFQLRFQFPLYKDKKMPF